MRAASGNREVIQIRVSAEIKSMLNRAAAIRGQKLSEFLLECALRQAEDEILDQRAFFLDPQAHEQFIAVLDAPAKRYHEVCARLTRKAPWEV